MRVPIRQFQLITAKERNGVITQLRELLSGAGGWLLDSQLYSNIAVRFSFEIPVENIGDFLGQCAAAGLPVTGVGETVPTKVNTGEVRGSLQVTFVHDEPDLRREVPAVPG